MIQQTALASRLALLALCAYASIACADPVNFDNTKARTAETTFGNLLADAIRAAAEADLGFVNAGATKERSVSAESGDELVTLLVYPKEKVAVLSLTGEQIRKALERGLSALPKPGNGFLQVAGIQVSLDPSAPARKRVKTVTLVKTKKPLAAQTKYRVATTLSLAKGGQGYFTVFGRDAMVETCDSDLRRALEAYAPDARKLASVKTGRLKSTAK